MAYAANLLSQVAKYVALTAASAGVTVAGLSAALSTQTGLQTLLGFINTKIPGTVRASKAEFALDNWGSARVRLLGLEVREKAEAGGQPLLAADVIECGGSPWQLITGQPVSWYVSGGKMNGGYNPSVREFRLITFLEQVGALEAPPPRPPAPLQNAEDGKQRAPQSLVAPTAAGKPAAAPPQVVDEGSDVADAGAPDASAAQSGAFMRALSDTSDRVGLTGELRQAGMRVVIADSQLLCSSEMRDILGGDMRVLGAFSTTHLEWLRDTAPLQALLAEHQNDNTDAEHLFAQATPLKQLDTVAGDGSAGAAGVAAGAALAAWWAQDPEDPVVADRLRRARRVWGDDACVPGEWQISSPNLDMRLRLWEASRPLAARALHNKQQLDNQQQSTQPTDQQPHQGTQAGAAEGQEQDNVTLLHEPGALALRFSNALSRFGLATVNPLLGRVTSLSEGTRGSIRASWEPDGMMLPYSSASLWVEPMCLSLGGNALITQLGQGLWLAGVRPSSWLRKTTKQDAPPPPASHSPKYTHATLSHASETDHNHTHDPADDDANRHTPPEASDEDGGDEHLGNKSERGSDKRSEGSEEPAALMEAWLSGQHIRFERTGLIRQCRVDMLLGPPGLQQQVLQGDRRGAKAMRGALHLVVWGKTDTDTDQLDMIVGVPEEVLARMGVKGLPSDYCLPLRLYGDTDAPRLELSGLSARIAQLLMRHAAHHAKQQKAQQQQHQQHSPHEYTDHGSAGVSQTASYGSTEAAAGAGSGSQDIGQQAQQQQEQHKGGSKKGMILRGVVRVAKAAWGAALHLLTPDENELESIRAQIDHDAGVVPEQECVVPWVEAIVR